MIKKSLSLLFIIALVTYQLSAQKNIRSFIFGHSLINHEFQVNPTPSQETSVPHWMHFLSEEAGYDYALSGQYGFLPQHANLPPIAQWGFDFAMGAWESDYEPFSAADFNTIMITPGNFIQWQAPSENYPYEDLSPLDATTTIIDWCNQQEDSLIFYIYENWPDMAPYLSNDFPPTPAEWQNYNDYLNSDFHDWFLTYQDALIENIPTAKIKMIPVGPIISDLLAEAPFDQIPIDILYEDDAPHGRPTIYFLASLISYMAMYEERAPNTYQVESIIHPIIADNYVAVVNFIWEGLNDFNFDSGQSRVFCDSPITSLESDFEEKNEMIFSPNPVSQFLFLEDNLDHHTIEIYSINGQNHFSTIQVDAHQQKINLDFLSSGYYLIVGHNNSNSVSYWGKVIKL